MTLNPVASSYRDAIFLIETGYDIFHTLTKNDTRSISRTGPSQKHHLSILICLAAKQNQAYSGSRALNDEMQKVRVHDDDGSGSGYSDLTGLENDTDTLGKKILQRERDARRIQQILSGSQRPFSRAVPRSASQRLQRLDKPAIEEAKKEEQAMQRAGTQRYPRTLKIAKLETAGAWTKMPRMKLAPSAQQEQEADEDAIVQHRTAYTGDQYWQMGEQDGLLVEDTPPSMRRSQPSSMRHMNTTIADIDDGGSHEAVLASTPTGRRERRDNMFIRERLLQSRMSRPTQLKDDLPIPVLEDAENLTHDSDKENQPQNIAGITGQHLQHTAEARDVPSIYNPPQIQHRALQPLEASRMASSLGMAQEHAMFEKQENADEQDIMGTPAVTGGWIDTPKSERVGTETSQTAGKFDNHDTPDTMKAPARNQQKDEDRATRQPLAVLQELTEESIHDIQEQQDEIKEQQAKIDERLVQNEASSSTQASKPDTGTTPMPVGQRSDTATRPATDVQQHIANVLTAGRRTDARQRTTSVRSSGSQPRRTGQRSADDHRNCAHCGGPYVSIWQGLWTETKDCFYFRDNSSLLGFQPTWFGAVLIGWLVWLLVETTVCKFYGRSMYAFKMNGYGADYAAPYFPFATPMLVLQPLNFAWQPVVEWLSLTFGAISIWLFGETAYQYSEAHLMPRMTYLPNGQDDRRVQQATQIAQRILQ